MAFVTEQLVVAIVAVNGLSKATTAHGDAAIAARLNEYYEVIERACAKAGGRVIKVIGDGIIVAFPAERCAAAVDALRGAQREANMFWQAVDGTCRVVIKAGSGPIAAGTMGPPGNQRSDIYGATLNEVFRLPPGEFALTPALTAAAG